MFIDAPDIPIASILLLLYILGRRNPSFPVYNPPLTRACKGV